MESIRGDLTECNDDLEDVLYELGENLTEICEPGEQMIHSDSEKGHWEEDQYQENQYQDLKAGLEELLVWGEELAKREQLPIQESQERALRQGPEVEILTTASVALKQGYELLAWGEELAKREQLPIQESQEG